MPTIFISYSHDSEEHAARVLSLADQLNADGLPCTIDQYVGSPDEDWPRWMERQIREADFILTVCTETYYKRVTGEETEGVGKGVKWEANILYNLIYHADSINAKVLPVIFEPAHLQYIPLPIKGEYYLLNSWEGYEKLYWRLTGQDAVQKPKPGQIKKRPPRKRGSLFETVPQASPLALPEISLGSLPVTGPDLFGREKELAQLDAAWENPQTKVFVLVAWGGVGKTSLVNKWLFDNMAKENYRGAQRVFGWSFYSQGAGESKQASADRFVADALRWFGDPNPDEGDPIGKGERLAALIKQQKTLLVLDGLEPLQYPPGSEEGRLRDRGLCVLLRELAAQSPGLCLITTRLAVNDLKNFFSSLVENVPLTHLSPEAGAQVLSNLGVLGTDRELKQAAEEFDGHALALNLLGRYLAVVHDGDIRKRDLIPHLTEEEEKGGHARRVMESYESWLQGTPELNILSLLGLFDRPAERGAIEALLKKGTIKGLTDNIHNLSDKKWKYAVRHLRDLRLLAEKDEKNPDTLDCHPLVREHFGEKLQQAQPDAWQEAHSRLYEYYKNLPEKELPDTLEEMEPLFAAVAHGCLASRHQEALDEVYWERIQRKTEFYTTNKLGAFGSDLAAVANFFEELWSRPAAGLTEHDKASVLNWAGFRLRAMGRLREAAQPMQTCIEFDVSRERWRYAAIAAGNLSELWLTLGEVAQVVEAARQSVEFADRSGDGFQKEVARTQYADALHQAGELSESEKFFREAEQMQQERQPEYAYLYSLRGFQFCDLLLSLGQYQEVQQRAAQTLEIAKRNRWLLDIALDRLSLGRAFLLQVCPDINVRAASSSRLKPAMPDNQGASASLSFEAGDLSPDLAQAAQYLDQAVAGLREAGQQDELPRGLLARAALFRVTQEFDKARADLHEAHEIAARGEMRLYLTDYHLEAARLRLAELSSPLDSRSLPDSGSLLSSAREHVEKAAELVEKTGYHRRNKEVEALQGFLISKDSSV